MAQTLEHAPPREKPPYFVRPPKETQTPPPRLDLGEYTAAAQFSPRRAEKAKRLTQQ